MIYLHSSDIVSHGNLKSTNCLIDSRWVLQITDFGIHEFRSDQEYPASVGKQRENSKLWKAPELLRCENPPARGTQKGDIYSFGIIMYEIIGRRGPWGCIEYSVQEIIDRVTNPMKYSDIIFRPSCKDIKCSSFILDTTRDCWREEPEHRPDFTIINIRLREMQAGL